MGSQASRLPRPAEFLEFFRFVDWAVLCSKEGRSSILVFWSGRVDAVEEIAKADDQVYFQIIDAKGTYGYRRVISPADRVFILEHSVRTDDPRLPNIDHEGIDIGFVEKGSVVHYWYNNTWLELPGAD